MGDKRSAARPKPNQGGCLVVAALVLMACLYANSNPAIQEADDGIALRLARVAELDVEVQGHAALRDAARSDVEVARAKAEHIEEPPELPCFSSVGSPFPKVRVALDMLIDVQVQTLAAV